MHTDPADARDDLMAAFFALPFGSTGHAHAAHNGFTINYGGRRLRRHGLLLNFNDKHTLLHYRSRGHNTILADGLAQVIGENGYGWLARFCRYRSADLHAGRRLARLRLDPHALLIDRMEKSGVAYTRENGLGGSGCDAFPAPLPLSEARRDRPLRRTGGPRTDYLDVAAAQPPPADAAHGAVAVEADNGLAVGRMDPLPQAV